MVIIKSKYLIIMLILVSIISIGAVSAADDMNNTEASVLETTDELSVGGGLPADDDLGDSNIVDENDELSVSDVEEEISVENDEQVFDDDSDSLLSAPDETNEILTEGSQTVEVYIGQNTSEGGGNGTLENPFNSLNTAFDSVSSLGSADNIANVTVYIANGTYALSKNIKLNDNTNYIIKSMSTDDEVKITGSRTFQLYNSQTTCYRKIDGISFEVMNFNWQSCTGFIEMYNTKISSPSRTLTLRFTDGSRQNFINCTFEFKSITTLMQGMYNSSYVTFSNCTFFKLNGLALYDVVASLDNCLIVGNNYANGGLMWGRQVSTSAPLYLNVSYSSMYDIVNVGNLNGYYDINYNWWGKNNITESINFNVSRYEVDVPSVYAIFNTTSNYLGNNQWEIIGKLTWNDGTTEGIEKFNPMSVSLNSTTGIFDDANPILKDGIFRVIYTSDSLTHNITSTLDREVQTLSFLKKIDVNVKVDDIIYGEYANVTVTIPTDIDAMFNITVNNHIYPVKANASVVLPINELLEIGNYTVDVVLFDAENNIYGSNSTTFEVKKIEANIDSVLNITVPSDATSTSFTINLANATGNLTVFVNNKTYTKELVNGSATVDINDLPAGTYNAIVSYSGDGIHSAISKNTTITIKKVLTSITASGVSTTYGTSKKITITLKDANKNLLVGKTIIVVLNGVKYTKTTDSKGQVSLATPANLAVKTHTATITFAGDNDYEKSTATSKVVVKKAASKITASKKTFKAKTKVKKYTITLKSGKKAIKKVKITLKIKGKTYKATTNAKGKATFKINKLTKKGKHTAVIKFKGNKNYKASSKKVKITIKK